MLQLCPECVIHEEGERGTHMNARSMTAVEVLGEATKSSALIGEGLHNKRRSHGERGYIGNPTTQFRA